MQAEIIINLKKTFLVLILPVAQEKQIYDLKINSLLWLSLKEKSAVLAG